MIQAALFPLPDNLNHSGLIVNTVLVLLTLEFPHGSLRRITLGIRKAPTTVLALALPR